MNPAAKRFQKKYEGVANAIARLDLAQEDRELVAEAVSAAFAEQSDPDFRPETFVRLASDPLVKCLGYDDRVTGEHVPCPHGREIRIHAKRYVDGEVLPFDPSWRHVRCVSCGASNYIVGFAERSAEVSA